MLWTFTQIVETVYFILSKIELQTGAGACFTLKKQKKEKNSSELFMVAL